jgi:hypothetical protein
VPNESLLEPAPHEFDAYLTYTDHGLDPFYAFANAIKRYNGGTEGSVTIGGDEFAYSLGYEDSGIARLNHPSCDLETIREYRIHFQKRDDVGEYGGSFHVAPRSPNMEDADGAEINAPSVTGIAIRAQGSNIPFEHYESIFRTIVRHLGIDPTYFEDVDEEFSTVLDAEVYVRVRNEESGPIYATDGPIESIYQLLHDDRSGYRKRVADHTEIEGYYQTATIGSKRAAELVDLHELAKEIKHYHVKNPDSLSPNSPLRHPKVGVSYQRSRDEGSLSISGLEQLERELDEVLLNVLRWAGLPVLHRDFEVDGDGDLDTYPYVEDSYFTPDFSRRQRRLVADPTPDIQAEQEKLAYKTLADGLTESDQDLLEMLVNDGGRISPQDAAEETDYHISTIYKAIDRMDHLVDHGYGELALESHHVAREVHRIVDAAMGELENAADVAARALANDTSMEIANDALTRFCDSHGIEIETRQDGKVELRMGQVRHDEAKEQLRMLVHYWRKGGWDLGRLADARMMYRDLDGTQNINPAPLKTVSATA